MSIKSNHQPFTQNRHTVLPFFSSYLFLLEFLTPRLIKSKQPTTTYKTEKKIRKKWNKSPKTMCWVDFVNFTALTQNVYADANNRLPTDHQHTSNNHWISLNSSSFQPKKKYLSIVLDVYYFFFFLISYISVFFQRFSMCLPIEIAQCLWWYCVSVSLD